MTLINWLHISDWHQREDSSDRQAILGKLLQDIDRRSQCDGRLAKIDFIIFSGDISFSGEREQFERASEQLVEPILHSVGAVPIYCVPGNHDIKWSDFSQIPSDWTKILTKRSGDDSDINNLLQDAAKLEILNKPLKNFYDFAKKHGCEYSPRQLHSVRTFEKVGYKIGIACLNTAWHSARFKIHPADATADSVVWDHGVLRVAESQIRDTLKQTGNANLSIAIMHHPLYWLAELEQAKAELMISRHCHVVLHGHEHRPNMSRLSNAFGDVVTIPAGASYNRRIAADPRYTNAFNFCSIELESNVGTIFHRIWSEEHDEWRRDDRFWADGRSLFFIQKKQPSDQQKIARKALNQLSRNYLPHVYRRSAISQEVILRHQAVTMEGERFIKAHVRFKLKLHPGELERFPIRSLVNKRIALHTNPNIRRSAYNLLKFVPSMTEEKWTDDRSEFEGYCEVGPDEQDLEYEYEMLETTDGFYYFNLRRFTERVVFSLIKDPNFEYEDLPFGGFPSKEPVNDRLLNVDDWVTDGLSLPNQGLIIQWYPKPSQATEPRATPPQTVA
jgi:predicted phosphodiesterase